MTLVDTSVWIDHLRRRNRALSGLLEEGEVLTHPFVIGELALGNLANRREVLHLLRALPESAIAEHEEAMTLLETQRLHGRGLGWVDLHLLAAALLSGCRLWTRDARLRKACLDLGLAVPES